MKAAFLVLALCGCATEFAEWDQWPTKMSKARTSDPAYSLTAEGSGMRQPADEAATLTREGDRLFLK